MIRSYLEKQVKRNDAIEMFMTVLIPLISVFAGRFLFSKNLLYSVLLGLFLGFVTMFLLYFRDKAIKNSSSYTKGLKGEKYIEGILKQLPQNDYKVVRPKLIHYGNIDFLVISKNGIFCIEVKNIGGKISYDKNYDLLLHNGFDDFVRDPLKQTKGNAYAIHQQVKEKIKTDEFVRPVLVFSAPGAVIDIESEAGLVKVLSADRLINYLLQPKRQVINSQTIEAVTNLYK